MIIGQKYKIISKNSDNCTVVNVGWYVGIVGNRYHKLRRYMQKPDFIPLAVRKWDPNEFLVINVSTVSYIEKLNPEQSE